MAHLIESQLRDALVYIEGLSQALKSLADTPAWGEGMHLRLPDVIPLTTDYPGDGPVAYLVANDFDGYDLTTTNPTKENN